MRHDEFESGLIQQLRQRNDVLWQPINSGVNINAPATIVTVQPQFSKENVWSLMKGASRKKIRKSIVGTHKNDETGWELIVTGHTADHAISSASQRGLGGAAHLEAVAHLPELIKAANLIESHKDVKNQKGVKQIHRFYAPMQLGDSIYAVKITAKEHTGKIIAEIDSVHRLYDVSLEKKMPGDRHATQPVTAETATASMPPTPGIVELIIGGTLKGVNDHSHNSC